MPTEYTVDVLRVLDDGELRSAPALRQLVASATLDARVDDAKLTDAVNSLLRDGALERWTGDLFVITDRGRELLADFEIGPADGWLVDDDVVMEYAAQDAATRKITVPVENLREYLAGAVKPNTVIDVDTGVTVVRLAGHDLGIVGTGETEIEAVDHLIRNLRQHAAAYEASGERPMHRPSWALVQLIELSDDRELRNWILRRDEDDTRSRLLRARSEIDAALAAG